MRIGAYTSAGLGVTLDQRLRAFERVDAAGFHTAWLGQTFDHDALTVLSLAGRITSRVELGSWVIPTYPRHPVALAQQALTVQEATGGRLALGIGPSHRTVIADRFGLDYSRPLRHTREYLEVLRPLLAGEQVEYAGDEFRVSLQLASAAPAPPVLLAALGPRMLELAGRAADGVAIWLGGPRYLERFALPRLRSGGRDLRIVCGLPIVVTRDGALARRAANSYLAQSSRLPAYRRVLEIEGARQPEDVAIIGDEDEVRRALARLENLGVTDLNAVVVPVPDDPDTTARGFELMAALAGERR